LHEEKPSQHVSVVTVHLTSRNDGSYLLRTSTREVTEAPIASPRSSGTSEANRQSLSELNKSPDSETESLNE